MARIPKVTCRGCGCEFSALRAECPQCGLRRTIGDPVRPVSAPRPEQNRKPRPGKAQRRSNWQLAIGLLLIAAAVLAVVLMLNEGRSGQAGRPSKPTPTPSPTYEPRPTPTPSPTPTVSNIKIFFLNNEVTDFTMRVGDAPLTVSARAYPNDKLTDARFTWRVSDSTKVQLTPSEDTQSCEIQVLASAGGAIDLTVECYGVSYTIPLRVWEPD